MRKLYVEQLRAGMVLGRTLYNDRGDVLLTKGVELTERYISALQKMGYYAVYVNDGVADDIDPPEDLSDQVRMATYKHVRELFAVVQSASEVQAKGGKTGLLARMQEAASNQISQLYRDVEQIVDEVMTAETMSGVSTLKTHDNYTFEHSIEVAVGGVMMGKRLGMTTNDLHQLALGCLCHDIGKLVVPSEVLNKPGRLTPEEFEIIKRHPQSGYDSAQQFMRQSDLIARHVIWQHHERQDGMGYPRGLKGNNRVCDAIESRFGKAMMLPAAEIAAVADVYSAIASDRPYRPAMKPHEIVDTLRKAGGTQLNSELVHRFLSVLPTYPVGSEVVIVSRKFRDHRGVVTAINPGNIHRPKLRLLFDPTGRKISPIEIDASKDKEIQLATSTFKEMTRA